MRQNLRLSRREFVIVDEPLLPRRFERREPRLQKRRFRRRSIESASPTGTASPTESASPTGTASPTVALAFDGVVFASSPATPAPSSRRISRPSAPAAPAAPSAGAIERRLAAFGGKVHRATVLQTEAAHESVVRLSRLSRRLEVPGGAVRFARVINLRAPRTHPVGTDIARGAPGDADERVRGRVRVVAPVDRGPAGRGTVLGDAIVEGRLRERVGRWGKVRGKG